MFGDACCGCLVLIINLVIMFVSLGNENLFAKIIITESRVEEVIFLNGLKPSHL
jgi:hypothetical protein